MPQVSILRPGFSPKPPQEATITRRDFLATSSALASASLLTGCAPRHIAAAQTATLPAYDAVPPLALIRAHADRLYKITVCLRPFRAQGPRIEAEQIGSQTIVHNYGHGGSGWSLSWGSAAEAMHLAFTATGSSPAGRPVAVIGCGAIGLTLATMLQHAGAQVTLYAKDRPQDTRSFNATGSWTPNSRIALTQSTTPAFKAQWERMARVSWRTYAGYLSLPGNPVEFTDRYILSDDTPQQAFERVQAADPIGFVHLHDLVEDLTPSFLDLPPGTHPFPTRYARRNSQLMFNITELVHLLTEDFLVAGGRIETRTFNTPAELAQLPQQIVFNCTGYGARALFADNSITPVRGQIGWLIPQPECNYGLVYNDLNVLCRRDGIVVQLSEKGEATGWQETNEQPDRREAEEGVRQLQALYTRTQRAVSS